jgi:hypothetical protein
MMIIPLDSVKYEHVQQYFRILQSQYLQQTLQTSETMASRCRLSSSAYDIGSIQTIERHSQPPLICPFT